MLVGFRSAVADRFFGLYGLVMCAGFGFGWVCWLDSGWWLGAVWSLVGRVACF